MNFNYQKDNFKLIERLNEITRSRRISHAYIFEGDSWIDKNKFAVSFAKGVFCNKGLGENCGQCNMCDKIDHDNCEDLIYVRAEESGNVKDESIERMQERIKTKPFGDRHIVIIEKADNMTIRAQNRLLKTLEEPPGDTVIILLCENMENLVQTIRSRCVKFHINHLGSEAIDYMMETAHDIVNMAIERRGFYETTKRLESILKSRNKEEIKALLDSMEVVYRDILIGGAGKVTTIRQDEIVRNIHLVEEAAADIRVGVSPSTAIKNLIIKIGG